MILQRLTQAETLRQFPIADQDEVGFGLQNVSWEFRLDGAGRCLSAVPLSEVQIRGNKERTINSQKRFIMARPRSQWVSCFPRITDTAEYVLGLVETTPKRAAERHQAYIELVQRCYEETSVADVHALLRFLDQPEIPDVADRITAKDVIDVNVNGRLLSDWPEVRAFWTKTVIASEEAASERKRTAVRGQCLVCGRKDVPIARLHSIGIKGVPGTQPSGAPIVSANDPVYYSYGKEQSAIAPTCESCARTYALVLNKILRTEQNHRKLGDAVMVYWTKTGTPSSLEFLLSSPQPEEVAKLIESVHTGRHAAVEADAFYSMMLSGHDARVVVRDWAEVPLAEVEARVAEFFERQQVLPAPGWRYRGAVELCGSLVPAVINRDRIDRDRLSRLPANLLPTTVLAILRGRRLPVELLSLAVERTRTEGMGGLGPLPGMDKKKLDQAYDKRRLAENRAAVITLILKERGVNVTVGLDTSRDDVAYLCGRLLAVLEWVQYKAVGEVNTTIGDRFFGSASRTPGVVLPTLISRGKSHLGTIRRKSPGLAHVFTEQIGEIASRINDFPRHLNTEEQGLFDLGYLHQAAHDRT